MCRLVWQRGVEEQGGEKGALVPPKWSVAVCSWACWAASRQRVAVRWAGCGAVRAAGCVAAAAAGFGSQFGGWVRVWVRVWVWVPVCVLRACSSLRIALPGLQNEYIGLLLCVHCCVERVAKE